MPTPIQQWIEDYCEESSAISGGIVMLSDGNNGATRVAAAADLEAVHPDGLRKAADKALKTQAPVLLGGHDAEDGSADAPRVVSVPLHIGEQPIGALALELNDAQQTPAQTLLSELEQAAEGS